MSVFLERNHLFLRNPHGGVEGVREMKEAGFGVIFCNVKDYAPDEWEAVRQRAEIEGVICGPWSRMCSGEGGSVYDPDYLNRLIAVADDWGTPLIVNAESEINGHSEYVSEFVEACGSRDWALSTEPTPYADNDWTMLGVPVLPQVFGPEYGRDAAAVRTQWQGYGVRCVVHTFGTYSGWKPELYPLDSPYGLYTADDCGNNYAPWSPRGETNPCVGVPPTNGDDMKIGQQNGIEATYNRLKKLDPEGCNPAFDPKNWGMLPVDQLKAYDKWCRTMMILVQDHDASA